MHVFASGAKSTEEKERFDLVPLVAIKAIAQRLGYGASRHGEKNYEKGWNDPVFIRDRKNHAFEHLVHYINGDTTADKDGNVDTPQDHLGAALTNLAMLARLEEMRDEKAKELLLTPAPSLRERFAEFLSHIKH